MYGEIAQQFSKTRGYVWPCVKRFLTENMVNTDAKVLEAGCGNGRNLVYARDLGYKSVEGFDICPDFVDICKGRGLNVVVGDILEPIPECQKYDIIISIAVIHHLDTEEKRLKAIRNLLGALTPGGQLLMTFWSYEKGNSIAQKDFQLGDNIVPWRSKDGNTVLSNRYYYIYNEDAMRGTMDSVGIDYELTWEEQNWVVLVKN